MSIPISIDSNLVTVLSFYKFTLVISQQNKFITTPKCKTMEIGINHICIYFIPGSSTIERSITTYTFDFTDRTVICVNINKSSFYCNKSGMRSVSYHSYNLPFHRNFFHLIGYTDNFSLSIKLRMSSTIGKCFVCINFFLSGVCRIFVFEFSLTKRFAFALSNINCHCLRICSIFANRCGIYAKMPVFCHYFICSCLNSRFFTKDCASRYDIFTGSITDCFLHITVSIPASDCYTIFFIANRSKITIRISILPYNKFSARIKLLNWFYSWFICWWNYLCPIRFNFLRNSTIFIFNIDNISSVFILSFFTSCGAVYRCKYCIIFIVFYFFIAILSS